MSFPIADPEIASASNVGLTTVHFVTNNDVDSTFESANLGLWKNWITRHSPAGAVVYHSQQRIPGAGDGALTIVLLALDGSGGLIAKIVEGRDPV